MSKVRMCLIAAISAASVVPAGAAWAAAGGDSNAGDVWVDNVGQPSGPGHEMDPHLACADINLWGSGLADTSGTFSIDGWPPSGSGAGDTAYSSTWSYSHDPSRKSGSQVIAVIPVIQLIQQAAKNGDAPKNKNGYHFKLQFSQDPQKHKTFWVSCTPPGTPGGPIPVPPGQTPTPTPTPTTTTTTTTTTTPTGSTTTPSTTTTSQTTTTGGSTTKTGGKKTTKRHHRLHKPKRHHKARTHHVKRLSGAGARFTG